MLRSVSELPRWQHQTALTRISDHPPFVAVKQNCSDLIIIRPPDKVEKVNSTTDQKVPSGQNVPFGLNVVLILFKAGACMYGLRGMLLLVFVVLVCSLNYTSVVTPAAPFIILTFRFFLADLCY